MLNPREMKGLCALCVCLLIMFSQGRIGEAQQGFLSIDCGAVSSYTDDAGISWVPDRNYSYGGEVANISDTVTASKPLQTLRYFKGAQSKYCFNLGPVNISGWYLVRATFLYGNYDSASAFPIFNISVDASPWATITIVDSKIPVYREFIAVATSSTSFGVCLLPLATGTPFISTLEVRALKGSMYSNSISYLGPSFLTSLARINFGANSTDSVRYPDDPTDRIWESDQVFKLDQVAPGTQDIRTSKSVSITPTNAVNAPAEKVMQTAVLGTQGYLTYRLNLAGLPANCYAVLYWAEIQDLQPNDTRSFIFTSDINSTLFKEQPLDLTRDVGVYTAYQQGFSSVVIPQLVNFKLQKTNNSNIGPLLNAMEVYQILPLAARTDSADVTALTVLTAQLPAGETFGDPCLPVSWDFISCSSDSPARVTEIKLSRRNLTGTIPQAIGGMSSLVNLELDGNQLTGSIPDLSQLSALETLHLQDNRLSGPFPSSLANLDNLKQVIVSNNRLNGSVPSSLLHKSGLLLQASGNPDLCANTTCSGSTDSGINTAAVVGGSVGGALAIILLAAVMFAGFWRHRANMEKRKFQKDPMEGSRFPFQQSHALGSSFEDHGDLTPSKIEGGARQFRLSELATATNNFSQMIGSGGYGPVYYGNSGGTQEIAVKVLSASSSQGTKEFFNEVNLLSRVHHRNLVTLIGYCPDIKERMLVYEYLHNGSLRDHLHGPLAEEEPMDWLDRLKIVFDAAKGLEYLHTACNPSIIHRDVKSSNILINSKFIGKVADFGLSKLTSEDASAVSTTVRGTVGYLDPEYYVSQQLTIKSDVFSFGVVLLEILTGREPIMIVQQQQGSTRSRPDTSNLVNWARARLQTGDLQSMVDPALEGTFRADSVWKLAELALRSVEPHSRYRPTMSEIVVELTDIINIEKPHTIMGSGDSPNPELSDDDSFQGFTPMRSGRAQHSPSTSFTFDSSSIMIPPHSGSLTESYREPILR